MELFSRILYFFYWTSALRKHSTNSQRKPLINFFLKCLFYEFYQWTTKFWLIHIDPEEFLCTFELRVSNPQKTFTKYSSLLLEIFWHFIIYHLSEKCRRQINTCFLMNSLNFWLFSSQTSWSLSQIMFLS